MSDVSELGHQVTEVVANPDAAIAIRDTESTYLWVNARWEALSTVKSDQVVGKKLRDLDIVPLEQADRFLREDRITKERLRLVTVNTYHVGGDVPIRLMTVRVLKRFRDEKYIIEVSFILSPLITSVMLGWSSERLERAFGEDLAVYILNGDSQ